MGCTGLCERFGCKSKHYRNGWRYCSRCAVFDQTESVRCRCCNNRLRFSSVKPKDGMQVLGILVSEIPAFEARPA